MNTKEPTNYQPVGQVIRDRTGAITYEYDIVTDDRGYPVRTLKLHNRIRPVAKPWRGWWVMRDGSERPFNIGDVERYWPATRREGE